MLTIKERGWAGHFICANSCRFRRNTLVSDGVKHIVVSTVGNYVNREYGRQEEIGYRRYYETMAFLGTRQGAYIDADVSHELYLYDCQTGICADHYTELSPFVDNEANDMHDACVAWVVEHFDQCIPKHDEVT